jgi:serine/threonine protein kinase
MDDTELEDFQSQILDKALSHIEKYSFQQADPHGKPKHGRAYDKVGTRERLSLGDPNIISKILDLPAGKAEKVEEAKADLLLLYVDALYMNTKLNDPTNLNELLAYIDSVSLPVNKIPLMPIWCTPSGVQIFDVKSAVRDHYKKRNDAILLLYNSNSNTVDLYDFILNFRSYLYVDSECLCNLTTGGRNRLRVKRKFGEGKVGTAYMVLDQDENQYVMKSINDIGLGHMQLRFTTFDKDHRSPTNDIVVKSQRNSEGFISVGMDDFTNQTVMHMLLNLFLTDCPNYIYQYDAFICNTSGFNIMNIANNSDMAKYLDEHADHAMELCEEAIRQLFPVLFYLKQKQIGFSHNDLKTRNVFVHDSGTGPIFMLADFDKSSVSWGNLRFFNDTMYFVDLATPYEKSSVQMLTNQIPTRNTKLVGQSIAPYTMYNPRGYYATYDLYTLIFSMMFNYSVYKKFSQSKHSFMHKVMAVMCDQDPIIMATIHKYMLDVRKTSDEDLLSITNISGIMHKNNFKIRIDLADMMKLMEIQMFEPSQNLVAKHWDTVWIGKTGRVCLNKPVNKRCATQTYKSYGMSYDYDNV